MTVSVKNISIFLLTVSCILGASFGLIAILANKEMFVFPSIFLEILTLFIAIYLNNKN